ncbi:hypothetical protein [Ensifer sp. YR511]|uniref:SMa0974 family conjugal transfer regulator n=1 Tax=Ensifer sp. YR511 TaxID=1855294 RepID=UPI0008910C24|nr:hypothetical protein [Ensifer sp. YR511]SDN47690.1 hypothetical protein SAMN05216328_12777 [Ensifer sp. YR511]
MYKHTAEAFVPVHHAVQVTQQVCARYGDYCRSIGTTGVDRVLDFGDARAVLRPTDEGLHFRIDAQDTITFYGIRTLLLGSLCGVAKFSGEHVESYPGLSWCLPVAQHGCSAVFPAQVCRPRKAPFSA